MKYILLFLISFNVFAIDKTYKIQVFRNSDNKQLYGLYADDSNRANRLANAMKYHKPGETILINIDITSEISAKEKKIKDRDDLIKNKQANTKDRFQALIERLGMGK